MSIRTADESLVALLQARNELTSWQGSGINEADTRAKIIDRVLKDVLGWDEAAIRREQRTADGQYVDYLLSSESNKFLLEAKREGIYFDIPSGMTARARRDGILSRASGLHRALRQVVDYCQSKGFAVGVVSNGLQMAATLVYPKGGGYDTFLFDGIDRISEKFILFWDLLSPTGDAEKTLAELLAARDFIRPAPQYSERLLSSLPLPDESMERNPAVVSLAPVIARFFSELVGEGKEEVLRQAYVESGRQAQYGKQLDSLLADHMPQIPPVVRDTRPRKSAAPQFDAAFEEPATTRPEGRVILLVGGVGAGKTTFVHRYFRYLITDELRERVVPVFLDFTRTSEESSLSEFVDAAVLEQLEEISEFDLGSWLTLQQMYRHEIVKLREGVLAPYWKGNRQKFDEKVADGLAERKRNSESHIGQAIAYLRNSRSVDTCVIFDNVDQFGQEFQLEAIRLALQRSRLWRCFGVLALREETYWRFRNTAPLDAFHRYAYHVAAPRIANVLSRRLELAEKELGQQSLTVRTRSGLEVSGASVGQFLQVIVSSFLGEDQRNIMLLESLCANDVRQALDMFETFLLSGHTNTEEYIKTLILSGSYVVPFHHVVRSIALGERRYYDSSRSKVTNLFSIEDDGFYSHFQKIRLLRYLSSVRQIDAVPGRGFVAVERLYEAFRGVISDEDGLRRVLDPLLRERLVEAANGYRVRGERADLVRITSAGTYYLNFLVNEFSYLDLVATDTPIKSVKRFDLLKKAGLVKGHMNDAVTERVKKVREFLAYLAEEDASEAEHLKASGLPDGVVSAIVPRIAAAFEEQVPKILANARRYGREIARGDRRPGPSRQQ